MSFFDVNTWPVEVEDGTVRRSVEHVHRNDKRFTNAQIQDRVGLAQRWTLTTKEMTPEDADTLEGLSTGKGHVFRMDDNAFSDQGAVWVDGSTVSRDLTQSKFGVASHIITDASWSVGAREDCYTLMGWRWNGAEWDFYAQTSNDERWVNTTKTQSVWSFWSLSMGVFRIVDITNYSDVVVLPFVASDGFINAVFHSNQPFSDILYPTVTISNQTFKADIEITGQDYTQTSGKDGWTSNARKLQVTLTSQKVTGKKASPPARDAYQFSAALDLGATFRSAKSYTDLTKSGVFTTSSPGPFGFGEFTTFTGGNNLAIPPAVPQSMGGRTAFSMVCWFKRSSLLGTQGLIELFGTAGYPKMSLQLDVTNALVGTVSSSAVDTDNRAGFSITDTTQWHMAAWVVDLKQQSPTGQSQAAILFLDGEPTLTTMNLITPEWIDDGITSRIGSSFLGDMSNAMLYDYALKPADLIRMYEAGKQGVFI